MAGHSKWANIQHRKGRQDAARSKLGTGHGRSQTSHVRYADFERESSIPNEVITLRYDSRDNLIALGVLPEPRRFWPSWGSFGRSPRRTAMR